MSDRSMLYTSAFLRALATGMVGILAGLYLAALQLSPARIGLVVAAGLAGAAAASLLATLCADAVGRRAFLAGLAVLAAIGGTAVALAPSTALLASAAFVGMLNGMGRDRGAALVIELAALPSTAPAAQRTRAFAVYNVLQDAGHALGSLLAGLPALLERYGIEPLPALRLGLGLYVLLVLLPLPLYPRLSPAVEAAPDRPAMTLTPESKRLLARIGGLFAIDSLGGGFLTAALLSLFFHERFGVGAGALASLFFGARALNALSHLLAAWLASRLGLVRTMVFTHVPSSLLLLTVAIAPSFPMAAVLFLLREGLVEMDVPTRQSYVMAVVRPEERTFASGVTHLVRMAAWAVAPAFAGLFMETSLVTPLVIGAALKLAYDGLLYAAFRGVRPPEER